MALTAVKGSVSFSDSINIMSKGAVGDGTTDSTAAINSALEEAAGSKAVIIPNGVFITSGILVSADNQVIISFGGTIKLKASSSNDLCTITGDNVMIDGGIWDGNNANVSNSNHNFNITGSNVTLRNFVSQNSEFYDILATNASGLKVENFSTSESNATSIFLNTTGSTAWEGLTIRNGEIDRDGQGSGVSGGGIKCGNASMSGQIRDIEISNVFVKMPNNSVSTGAICIETSTDCYSATVTGCRTKGGYMGISMAGTDFGSVTGNVCRDANVTGIEVAASSKVSVTGNSIDGADNTNDGIAYTSSSTDGTISSNTIYSVLDRGIELNTGCHRVAITGNHLHQTAGGRAFNSSGCNYLTIASNVFYSVGTSQRGINVTNGRYVTINGNTVSGFNTDAIAVEQTSGTMDNISITGNTIETSGNVLFRSGTIDDSVRVWNNIANSAKYPDWFDYSNDIRFQLAAAVPSTAAGNGSLAIDLTNHELYIRDAGSWVKVGNQS